MDTFDYKTVYKELYNPSAKNVSLVTVPNMKFIAVDGVGDPNTSLEFSNAVEVLYGISYGIKMMPKKGITPEGYVVYSVPPLEGLWWVEGERPVSPEELLSIPKEKYHFTMMIMQPPFVTADLIESVRQSLYGKKDKDALDKLRFFEWEEGLSVQIMHLGPYNEEPATLAKMEAYIGEHGYEFHNRHHEIYLGDPRRTAPEKLKTVLRHPVLKRN